MYNMVRKYSDKIGRLNTSRISKIPEPSLLAKLQAKKNRKHQKSGFAKKSLDFWRPKNSKNNKDFLGLDAPRMINSCGFFAFNRSKEKRARLKTKRLKISSFQLSKTLNAKGQLKIQQMAFMLLAVTLFFVLVGMFILVIKVSDMKKSAESLNEKNAMLLVTRLANSPELSCGNSFGTGRINCIDGDKMMMLKQNIGKYSEFFGSSNIQARKIYSSINAETECTLENYPNCNTIKIIDKKISAEHSNFVVLCRKEIINEELSDICEISKLMVGYEGK